MTQRELSIWLRVIVALTAICCLYLAVTAWLLAPVEDAIFLTFSAVPVFASLFLAWKIFADIGRDKSFTEKNAMRLRLISRLALLDTFAYVVRAVVLGILGINDFSSLIIIFLGIAMTVITAALSHLTRKAAALKSENDLTI